MDNPPGKQHTKRAKRDLPESTRPTPGRRDRLRASPPTLRNPLHNRHETTSKPRNHPRTHRDGRNAGNHTIKSKHQSCIARHLKRISKTAFFHSADLLRATLRLIHGQSKSESSTNTTAVGRPTVEPQVRPPAHRHQVAKPLHRKSLELRPSNTVPTAQRRTQPS
jgi:hypothetical protein